MNSVRDVLDKLEGFSITASSKGGKKGSKIQDFLASVVNGLPGYHNAEPMFREDKTDIKDQAIHVRFHATAYLRKNELKGKFEVVQAAKDGVSYVFIKWIAPETPKAAEAPKTEAVTDTEAGK